MSDDIEALARAEYAARCKMRYLAQRHTLGKTFEERNAASAEYSKAQREHLLARQALDAAMSAPPKQENEG